MNFRLSFKLVVELLAHKMDESKENIKSAAKGAIESVKSFAESAANSVKSVTNDAVESIFPIADESAKAVKDAATSATNTIRDFFDPPPEDSKTDFLAVVVGVLVASLLIWGIYKAFTKCKIDIHLHLHLHFHLFNNRKLSSILAAAPWRTMLRKTRLRWPNLDHLCWMKSKKTGRG